MKTLFAILCSFLSFAFNKLTSELGVVTTVLYQASGVSSTKGQLIVGNAKPVQGVNQVCVVKSQNINYFQDAGTILAPGVTTGNISAVSIPITGGSGAAGIPGVGDMNQMIPVAAGTLVLTAWIEIITPSTSSAFTAGLGVNSPVSSATAWGTALDLTSAAGTILAGADSTSVPVVSPIMFATAGTIDLTVASYTAGGSPSAPVVIVYALVVDLNF